MRIQWNKIGETLWSAVKLAPAQRMRVHYFRSCFFWNPLITLGFGIYYRGLTLEAFDWRSLAIAQVVSSTCFLGVWLLRKLEVAIYRFYGRSYGREAPKHGYAWYMGTSVLIMPFGLYLGFWVVFRLSLWVGTPWPWPNRGDFKESIFFGVLIAFFFVTMRARADARESAREAELRIRGLENERLQAQLSALTAQMNPHLLFNALNTVASLIASDPARAEETTLKLSDLYRGVLESSRRNTHSLATELELCSAYLSVERARFGDRLRSEVLIDPSVDPDRVEVPVLTLQPLVENAVRHGISPRGSGGTVRIRVGSRDGTEGRDLNLAVEDDGVGVGNSPRKGAGTGLENCRARLRLGFGERGVVSIGPGPNGSGTTVTLRMPVGSPSMASPVIGATP